MRYGFYGSVVNNMYVLARAAADAGLDVCFVRERGEPFAFSQPVWEDVALRWTADQLEAASRWSWEEWSRREREVGWQPPPWLVDPLAAGYPRWLSGSRRRHHWSALAALRGCDLIVVCGVGATLVAPFTGRPYVICPHGADIRLAAQVANPGAASLPWWKLCLLRLAYRRALAVANHDPTGVGGDQGDLAAAFPGVPFRHLPLPYPLRPRLAREERRRVLAGEIGEAEPALRARVVAVLPARLDFEWKGHDALLQGLARLGPGERPHVVASGWGRHRDEARARAAALGLAGSITFLPGPLSKPLLYRLFQAADLVVDQFRLGTYGTAAVEAMSTGAPVLMHLDPAPFARRGWEPPPVLAARTADEVAAVLGAVARGQLDLEAEGRRAAAWVDRVHGPAAVLQKLAALAGEAAPR